MADDKTPDWTASEEREKVVRFLQNLAARSRDRAAKNRERVLRDEHMRVAEDAEYWAALIGAGAHNDV